ncbi:Bifunctional dethiobiotin synthetase/7 [Abeliophyllum distichum]|uniref:Bifunctional dethiobiotin synthetase/7 n=1 Tax=Abeliophyllum distichum TaxID=126358 RepID=A0ABD1VBR3_9LAMI
MKLQGSEIGTDEFGSSELICKTMHGWKESVSPHLASKREGALVGDYELLETLKRCIGSDLDGKWCNKEELYMMCVIDTAGGVASPGPSGSLQCDLYRCVFLNISHL